MKKHRDVVAAAAAVILVAGLVVAILVLVLDAGSRGRKALERNQRSVVAQLASSMDRRIQSSLSSVQGLASRPLSFQIGDPNDEALLQQLQSLQPEARSGIVLVSKDGTVTDGTLLENRHVIGTKLDRPGLGEVFRSGQAEILPAAPGLTTSLPTIGIAIPVRAADGNVNGVMVWETVVAPDSDFNREIAALRQGRTGVYTFVDARGTVIVATDSSLLGHPLPNASLLDHAPGFFRSHGQVVAIADVRSAGWRLIFTQDASEFEAGLGHRLQIALLVLIAGALLAASATFIAVLRRLRAERDERRRIEEINETREEFVSIVSHEMRTPVAGILGFLQSLLDHWGTMDDDTRRHAVERACANAQRLQSMTRDVLDTTSVETGTFTYSFDVIDLAESVRLASLAAGDADPSHLVMVDVPDEPVSVHADADRLQQVLANLLDNALKNSPTEAPVEIKVTVDDDKAQVRVFDRGPGLGNLDQERVFEKFVRGRSTVRGTGLGLYVARRIVEAHDGRIWAEERAGGGAVFALELPLAGARVEPVSS